MKIWLIWKDPDAGKGWGQEEKGMTEDEMVGWHHRLEEHGFGWTPGIGDGQGGLACCSSWGRKELDTTEGLNWSEVRMVLNPGYNTLLQKWTPKEKRDTNFYGRGGGKIVILFQYYMCFIMMFVPIYLREQVSVLMLVVIKWKVSIQFHYFSPCSPGAPANQIYNHCH